jgi:hypothetical protein
LRSRSDLRPLERAAADHGLSVADFVEAAVLQAMVSAGVIQIEKQNNGSQQEHYCR